MFCPKCGAENNEDAIFCSQCGYKMNDNEERERIFGNLRNNDFPSTSINPSYHEGLDTDEKAMLCLGNMCISPLLGIILYFVWKDEKPQKADDVCQVTIWAVLLGIILGVLFAAFGN